MKALVLLLLTSSSALALELVSAEGLCERFITPTEKSACLQYIKAKKPDTYVSSLCHDLFDDRVFYQCLELAAKTSADPRKLEACQLEGSADEVRMACLNKVAKKDVGAFQRLPASLPRQK